MNTTPTLTPPTFVQPTKEQDQATFDTNIDELIAFLQTYHGEATTLIDWLVGARDNVAAGLSINGLTDELRAVLAGQIIGISDEPGNPLESVEILPIVKATNTEAEAGSGDGYVAPPQISLRVDAMRPQSTQAEAIAGTATTGSMAPLQVHQAVAEILGNRTFESSPIAMVLNTIVEVNHPFGQVPSNCWAKLRCLTPELSYDAGDEAIFCFTDSSNITGQPGLSASATKIYLPLGEDRPRVVNRVASPAANYDLITIANWELIICASL